MFPEPQYSPPGLGQKVRGLEISFHSPAKLRVPERPIRRRRAVMFWAAVPEAAIDEYGHILPSEHNVGPSSQCWDGTNIDPVPQTCRVQ